MRSLMQCKFWKLSPCCVGSIYQRESLQFLGFTAYSYETTCTIDIDNYLTLEDIF